MILGGEPGRHGACPHNGGHGERTEHSDDRRRRRLLVLWVLVSGRLERIFISAPLAFVVMGLAINHRPLQLIHLNLRSTTVRSLAEVTLALVLFSDASGSISTRFVGIWALRCGSWPSAYP